MEEDGGVIHRELSPAGGRLSDDFCAVCKAKGVLMLMRENGSGGICLISAASQMRLNLMLQK